MYPGWCHVGGTLGVVYPGIVALALYLREHQYLGSCRGNGPRLRLNKSIHVNPRQLSDPSGPVDRTSEI